MRKGVPGRSRTPACGGGPVEGSEGGARTRDLPINSRTLCQLSYLGPSTARGSDCPPAATGQGSEPVDAPSHPGVVRRDDHDVLRRVHARASDVS